MSSSNAHGVSVAYTYDSLNRLATVVDNNLPGGQNTTTYTYDPASNLATVVYPNGLQSSFTYDDLNRVTAMNAARASYSYTLSPTGKRTAAVESSGRTLNWTYDGIYRLTHDCQRLGLQFNQLTHWAQELPAYITELTCLLAALMAGGLPPQGPHAQ